MLAVSGHDAVDGGVVCVGDLGDVGEGKELSIGDRIEREQN